MSRAEPMCTLYVPRLEDMWFRQKMLADETTMFYNHAWGGVIDFRRKDGKAGMPAGWKTRRAGGITGI